MDPIYPTKQTDDYNKAWTVGHFPRWPSKPFNMMCQTKKQKLFYLKKKKKNQMEI